jgi:protein-tyrosine-phosphatase/predicted ATP-grasp superfamily ATP-dependent carboligase
MAARAILDSSGGALILDGHSRAAVETVQALGRGGIPVDVASHVPSLAGRSRYCRRALVQPDAAGADAFLEWVESTVAASACRLVVPTTENSLRCFVGRRVSEHLRQMAVLPSDESLQIALSKELTRERAAALGVRVPRSRLLTAESLHSPPLTFPVVLKPQVSLVVDRSRVRRLAPVVVRTEVDRVRALERLLPLTPVLEQEYVPGTGAGVECLYRHGQLLWCFRHERVHELPLAGGASTYRRSVPADGPLVADAIRLLDSLAWHGVAMVEFKHTSAGDWWLMEINPRLWGSLALALDAGVNFPAGLWSLACGENPGPQPKYRTGYYTRDLPTDIEWLKENLRADRRDPLLMTRPRLVSLLEYARPLLGRESWDHFVLTDWRVWGATVAAAARAIVLPPFRRLRGRLQAARVRRRHRRVRARLPGRLPAMPHVLFVCYGNICRSPLAEAHARSRTNRIDVRSSGFHDHVGRLSPDWYQDLVGGLGVDLAGHRSTRLDRATVDWADLVVAADADNLRQFDREFPAGAGKATLLGLFERGGSPSIDDPYNLEAEAALAATRRVLRAVDGLVETLTLRSSADDSPPADKPSA